MAFDDCCSLYLMQELGDHFDNIYLMQELHNKFLIKVHKAGDIPVMQVENGI